MPKAKKVQKKQLVKKQEKDKGKFCLLLKKLALFGFIFAVISMIIHTLAAFLEMSYYVNPAYFSLWSKIMMPNAGPPGILFYVLSFLFSFISGAIFACVFTILKRGIQYKGIVRGIFYAMLIFLVVSVQGYLAMILLVAVPPILVLYWAIESLVIYAITGIILGKMFK
jgi:hypothetical protein